MADKITIIGINESIFFIWLVTNKLEINNFEIEIKRNIWNLKPLFQVNQPLFNRNSAGNFFTKEILKKTFGTDPPNFFQIWAEGGICNGNP